MTLAEGLVRDLCSMRAFFSLLLKTFFVKEVMWEVLKKGKETGHGVQPVPRGTKSAPPCGATVPLLPLVTDIVAHLSVTGKADKPAKTKE